MTLTRRDALKLAAAAAAAPLLPAPVAGAPRATPGAAAAGRFFSAPEMALLDELVEMIIPADAHSGGARASGVAAYIDGRLADYDPGIPILAADRERWKAGLAAVDAFSRETGGRGFIEASPAERTALLERLSVGREELPTVQPPERRQPAVEKPETVGQRFFTELKSWTVRGYYTSRVGIHDDLQYQGNKAIVEFAGTHPGELPVVRPPGD
ncbi:MAG TPA: gluconate 2-dehydrogenase subunit 3 family protein [Vicinamibacteria bacterium]|nr:gluconate 2-dehydrogenase subunit 3 family protein [Vicinamibacteria bacterium]